MLLFFIHYSHKDKDAGQSLDRKNIKLSDVSCVAVCHSVCVLYLRAVSSQGWMVAPITNNVNALSLSSVLAYIRGWNVFQTGHKIYRKYDGHYLAR